MNQLLLTSHLSKNTNQNLKTITSGIKNLKVFGPSGKKALAFTPEREELAESKYLLSKRLVVSFTSGNT